MRKSLLVALSAFVLLGGAIAATPPKLNEKALKAALEDRLKDAESVKFKDITYSPTDSANMWNMCGQMNAKNSYGAYVGYQRFYALVAQIEKGKPPHYSVFSIEDNIATQMCAKFGL